MRCSLLPPPLPVVIDTTPFVNEYYNYPQNEEMRNQLRDQHWEVRRLCHSQLCCVPPNLFTSPY